MRFPTIEVRPGILGCLLVGLLACSPPGGPGAGAPEGTDPARVGISERLGDQAPLDTLFNDEEGRPIALKALVDKPTVLTLNYFACAGICTPLLHGVTEVLNTTARQPGRDFRVVTVSFDEKDTPSIAKMKRQNYLRELKRPFPPEAWRFLTGKGPSIRKLTDGVGFEFKASGKEFIHPGVLIVLSPQGVVTRYMYGINFLPADLDMAIDEAAKGVTRPSVVKALAFCYSLDPRGRKYVVKAASVVGTMTMLAALGFAAWLALGGRRTP
ncbi:MAG: SCO family protein [Elusimicrobia bacterium]|nr:SCO family protein [Elusimicrobiota bacterium]